MAPDQPQPEDRLDRLEASAAAERAQLKEEIRRLRKQLRRARGRKTKAEATDQGIPEVEIDIVSPVRLPIPDSEWEREWDRLDALEAWFDTERNQLRKEVRQLKHKLKRARRDKGKAGARGVTSPSQGRDSPSSSQIP
jgi:multidrug resistance efflux pump